jgi:DNA (cytosine-5)-methyltransferase 1
LFADTPKLPWVPVASVLELNNIGLSIFTRKKPLVDNTLRRIIDGIKKFGSNPMLITYFTPGYQFPIDTRTCPTVTAQDRIGLLQFGITYYGNGQPVSFDSPAPTVTTHDRVAAISCAQWIDNQYGTGVATSIESPSGTVLTTPKQKLITAFVVNPQYDNKGASIMDPAPTVIATQKSQPLSMCTALHGQPSPYWIDQPGDTATMKELRGLMREYSIFDIYLRMLTITELKRIQCFPDDYKLHGRSEEQKKFIGNAVPSIIPAKLALANVS